MPARSRVRDGDNDVLGLTLLYCRLYYRIYFCSQDGDNEVLGADLDGDCLSVLPFCVCVSVRISELMISE